jgi:hypothetical protein
MPWDAWEISEFLTHETCADGVQRESNPTIIDNPFWKYMISGLWSAHDVYGQFEKQICADSLVWCFDREDYFGTRLPDGRLVFIGGEKHQEDHIEGCNIYNDVIVIRPDQPPAYPEGDCKEAS